MFLLLCFAALMLLLSFYMISGNGGWLISGYNTLPPEEKAKYDERLLSKWIGYAVLLPLSLFIGAIYFVKSEKIILMGSALVALYLIGMIVLMNKKQIGRK